MATMGRVFRPEEFDQMTPIERNKQRISLIADAQKQELQLAIDANQARFESLGFTGPHPANIPHEAEQSRLSEYAGRVNYLIEIYEISEPVDEGFFYEVSDFLAASDYDRDWSGTSHSRVAEVAHLSEAAQNLQLRNAQLGQAA